MPPSRKKPGPKKIPKAKETPAAPEAKAYQHLTAESPARPAAGAQTRFREKRAPKEFAYDSSLAPELAWDGGNASARDRGEELIASIRRAKTLEEAKAAAAQLAGMSSAFLNWAGKKERLSFDVPTLPLFVHERLSTEAVLNSVRDKQLNQQTDLFGDPRHSIADQILGAYKHQEPWTNRMILGDSLLVMNSLLEYEGLGGKVQMIYIDPPYGVTYNSNFQPFVGKRDVKPFDDADLTREPEMVQAYRDTWEFGLHSYLSYLRDRLLLARELLTVTGSVFVQISDVNLHHVREILDEVFGAGNSCGVISFRKTGGQSTTLLSSSVDYLLWYARAKDAARAKFHQPTVAKRGGSGEASGQYTMVEPRDYSRPPREMTEQELKTGEIPDGYRVLAHDTLYSQGAPSDPRDRVFVWEGEPYPVPPNTHWKPGVLSGGMSRLAEVNRIFRLGRTLRYKRYVEDYPVYELDNVWNDTSVSGFGRKKQYVVETSPKVVERCVLMTTEPGDLVLDPTCGSGTTAYVAEQWGRRWITVDTSRVPMALARQRLLTSTFDWYQLKDETRGPAGGFVYKRRQNARGEEIGGIVPHVTLGSLANNESPPEEVLADRPEDQRGIVRVTGPFTVEATIPTPVDLDGVEDARSPDYGDWVERVISILRRSPTLHLGKNRSLELAQVRPPARTMALSAEAMVNGKPIAIVVGPEHGSVSERQVNEAGKEANAKNYTQLIVIGLAIEPNARKLIEEGEAAMGIPATYVQATPDLLMGDLLKTMRSSQIFSVCGLPDVTVTPVKSAKKGDTTRWQVTLAGLDIFDPVTMVVEESAGENVPCWMLDQDYDGMVFHATQVFFPRTQAWDALQRALKAEFDASLWEHLAGTSSTPFSAPTGKKRFTIAVKVIDPRGNELLVTREVGS